MKESILAGETFVSNWIRKTTQTGLPTSLIPKTHRTFDMRHDMYGPLPKRNVDRFGAHIDVHQSTALAIVPSSTCEDDEIAWMNMCHGGGCIPYYEEPPKKKLSFCKVEIEELSGGLATGVVTHPFARAIYVPPSPVKTIVYPATNNFKVSSKLDQEGNYVIDLDSLVINDDPDFAWEKGVWDIFSIKGLKVEGKELCKMSGNGMKYLKILHTVKLSKKPDHKVIPHIQFICLAHRVRYKENVYQKGQVITFNFPDTHGILSLVVENDNLIYVPMLKDQQIKVVDCDVSSGLVSGSNVKYLHSEVNKGVNCDYFQCFHDLTFQQIIIAKKGNKYHYIIIPKLERYFNSRYAIIADPIRTCVVHVQNIDGFIFRTRSKVDELQIDKGLNFKLCYQMEFDKIHEIKMLITSPISVFRIEKIDENKWIVKS